MKSLSLAAGVAGAEGARRALELLPQAPTVRCQIRLCRRRRSVGGLPQNTSCAFFGKLSSARPPVRSERALPMI